MPKKALTAQSTARLKPPKSGQIDYFDKGYPGLSLRLSYGGGRSWGFFYRHQGKLRRLTLGPLRELEPGEQEPEPKMGEPLTLKGARQLWRDARQDVQAGRDPAQSRKRQRGATDFESVSAEWLKRDQEDNKSYKEVKRIVDVYLLPHWKHRDVADIGRRDILDLIDGIADEGKPVAPGEKRKRPPRPSPIMARRVQAYVHRFFRWCVGRGIIEANPASALPKPGQERKRDRVLSDDELRAAWKAADEIDWPFGPAIQLLILTGARRQEIGGLCWSEIGSTGDPIISLSGDRTKNGEPKLIPLSKPALIIIQGLRRIGDSEFVFTTTGKTAVSGWTRAKRDIDKLAKIPHWTIHDLRRTVATGLQRLGVSLQVIEAVLGHVSGSRAGVVGVYQRHSFDQEKAAALEVWGSHVMSVVAGKKKGVVVPIRREKTSA